MKFIASFVLLFFSLLLQPANLHAAAEISGKVLQTAGPYLLLQTQDGHRVVRTDSWTAYGNLEGIGSLKYGGETVTVSYELQTASVPQALAVTKLTEYRANSDLLATTDEVAAGIKSAFLLVDGRSQEEWNEAHLSGAVIAQSLHELMPQLAKEREIIIYGSSAGDLRPFASARLLSAKGYKKVRVYVGGVKEWRHQGRGVYTAPAHLATLLESGKTFRVIDLRQMSPANTLLMSGTEEQPLASLSRSAIFLPDRAYQLPLFLYGEEGELHKAAGLLADWGFHNDGDFALLDPIWKEWFGKFVVAKYKPGSLPPEEITLQEFRALWSGDKKSSAVLLNVKPKRDREIREEIHIPLEELPERLGELPRDREIVIYCALGLRSALAWQILHDNGYRARFLNRAISSDSSGNLRNEN